MSEKSKPEAPAPDAPKDPPERRTERRKRCFSLLVLCLAVLLVFPIACCGVLGPRLADRANRAEPHGPSTGILIGAEERNLGPLDASGAVLFVHGFIGGGSNFNDLPERVAAQGWFVRVMRLPGHGTTPTDLLDVSADDLEAAVVADVETLRRTFQQVVVVGHSMGGSLGALVVAKQSVDRLILAAPYFGVTRKWYYGLPVETWVRVTAPILPWLYKGDMFKQVNRPEAKKEILSYRWVPSHAVQVLLEVGRRASDPAVLGALECPILLIHSRSDAAASPRAAAEAFNHMPSKEKQIVWLTRSNHHVFWDYEAEEVMQVVLDAIGQPP
jgi:carboxylesterase